MRVGADCAEWRLCASLRCMYRYYLWYMLPEAVELMTRELAVTPIDLYLKLGEELGDARG